MARTRTRPTPAPRSPTIVWHGMMSEVLRVIDANPRLVPEAVDTLLASDAGVTPTIIKGAGAGSLAAFSELIIDADALDADADPMAEWSPADLDAVYEHIAFMAAQRDLLHGASVVRALRDAGVPS